MKNISAARRKSVANNLIPSAIPMGRDVDDEVKQVDALLRKGANTALGIWIVLLALIYWLIPSSRFEQLEGVERNANVIAAMALFVTNLSRLVPLMIEDSPTDLLRTGIMSASLTCQVITMASVSLMAFYPTPVVIDHMTGIRVHLARWAGWTALAFLMTFMTEAINMPHSTRGSEHVWKHAWALGLSTACGLILPFCQTIYSFGTVLAVSMCFYSSIFIRLYQRRKGFLKAEYGVSVEDREAYDRVRLSLRLLETCAVLWTLLVITRLACFPLFLYASPGSVWSSHALPAMIEAFFEIASKTWYLILIFEVHEMVFDKNSRVLRRLEELRSMMTVVWENSSDIIALIVQGEDRANAVVSPTFLRMERMLHQCKDHHDNDESLHSDDEMEVEEEDESNTALVFGFHADSIPGDFVLTTMDLSKPITNVDMASGNEGVALDGCKFSGKPLKRCKNVIAMAKLLKKAWKSTERNSLLMHDLYGVEPGRDAHEKPVHCEVKVTRLESDAVVLVLRDVSERASRFEAEKQLLIELTERKMDAQANRFTRHEVKNGLLAAISMVGTVRDTIDEEPGKVKDIGEGSSSSFLESSEMLTQSIYELDSTLREVLDTVLSEAMARDVIHEVYQPRRERVEIDSILSNLRNQSAENVDRFPLETTPSPFPIIIADPQLLRYIHRNAISNACKYGKRLGVILTSISYDAETKEFQMNVTNLPGEGHSDLLFLDEAEVESVFSPGTRLHAKDTAADGLAPHSAGDGAWIMQKCAKIQNGKCTISFEPEHTVFSLKLPNVAASSKRDELLHSVTARFQLPGNTWGIAIDDSGIQRKLLTQLLSLFGIPPEKLVILGKDVEEIRGFTTFLCDLVREHASDTFLVIVDENLDILEGGNYHSTVSGSKMVQQIREELNEKDESRILALIRTANDSSEDISMYRSRAHGFLAKAPIKRDMVLDIIHPLWIERFPSADGLLLEVLPEEHDRDEAILPSRADMSNTLEVIDALLATAIGGDEAISAHWPAIREKLRSLKGDLKTMQANVRVTTVLDAINKLKGEEVPFELLERWTLIRSLIVSIM